MIIAFWFGLLLLLLYGILRCLKKHINPKSKLNTLIYKVELFLFWNGTLRFIIESYFILIMDSIMFFYLTPRIELMNSLNAYETIFAFITLTFALGAPICLTFYLRLNFKRFRVT